MSSKLLKMSSFLYTLLGLAVGSSLHCSVRQQISPCTCSFDVLNGPNLVNVVCEKMNSFAEVKHALKGQFTSASKLKLRITHSNLNDLLIDDSPGFGDLNVVVSHLNISDNNLTVIRGESLSGMGNVTMLNLADNLLSEVPLSALSHLPRLRTLTIRGNQLTAITDQDFKELKHLESLVLGDNKLREIGQSALPRRLIRLQLGRNQLVDLNNSLSGLYELEWLFLDQNQLTSLDEQLPAGSKLLSVNVSHNALRSLPLELHSQTHLEYLWADHNEIQSLGGALQKSKRLISLGATYNQITALNEEEFSETDTLAELLLGHNQLSELNGALRSLRALLRLSLHHNSLTEFDLSEIRGLRNLQEVDLRHNRIERLVSKIEMQNVVEVDTPRVTELRLGHNHLSQLDGFLLGLPGLRSLDLSHNRLRHLPPGELLNLDQLRFLDLSHNHLSSLADTSKKLLPSLETLLAGHNNLVTLDRDLHGLPALCVADLSYNQISRVGAEVAAGSACLVRGVPGTLRIFLQGNSLRCDSDLSVAQEETENNHAELVGVPDCEAYSSAIPIAPVLAPVPTAPNPTISLPEILQVLKGIARDEDGALPQLQPDITNMALQPAPILEVDEATYSEAKQNNDDSGVEVSSGEVLFDLLSTPPAE